VSAEYLYLVEPTNRVYVTGPARYTVIRTDLPPGVGEKTLVRPDASRPVLEVTPSLVRRAALVRLCLPVPGMARVTLHDVAGRVVRDLVRGELTRGVHDFRWDGKDNAGRRASPGVYLFRAETPRSLSENSP
jgi:hypothetical protein